MWSCDQSLVTLAFLWEKLSWPQFYKDLTRKITFFEGWPLFKFNNLELALGMNLKFYTSVGKGLKVKIRQFYGLVPTVVEVTGEKLVGWGGLFGPPSWIGLMDCLIEKLYHSLKMKIVLWYNLCKASWNFQLSISMLFVGAPFCKVSSWWNNVSCLVLYI